MVVRRNVYQPQLKPRLAAINSACGARGADTLPVDLLMVSHIDDDHINGVLELTGELVEAQRRGATAQCVFAACGTTRSTTSSATIRQNLIAAVTAHFGPASLTGEADAAGLSPDVAMVLASVGQGRRFETMRARSIWT